MHMFLERVCLIASVVTVVAVTSRRISTSMEPPWHLPCGEDLDLKKIDFSKEDLEEELNISLKKLSLQYKQTLDDYLHRDYEYLYEKVRIGVHDDQYIPNWVPGEKDVNLILLLVNASSQTIVNYFPKLHLDLQKFAVAFEELIEDEPNSQIQQALKRTQSYLMMMLCEVESDILSLPSLRLPKRVMRSIMSKSERNLMEDDTKRLIRDWGILLKYRNYLHAWRHVFKY